MMNIINITKSAPLAGLLFISFPLSCLAVDYGAEAQKPAQALSDKAAASRAADLARAKASDEGPEVTFAMVMKDPDNPELNYKYARSQVRNGNLKGAAATLERMLMINPALDDIRLFRAAVLYRMDDLEDAKAELDALAKAKLPPAMREEAESYRKLIAKRGRKISAKGAFTLGVSHDSNRNSAPSSGEYLFLNTQWPLTSDSRKRADSALITAANAELSRPFSPNSKNEAFVSGVYYRADQSKITDISLGALSFSAGARLRNPKTTITPELLHDTVLLDNESFLSNNGLSVRVDRKLNWNTWAFGEVKYISQKFLNTSDSGANDERTGSQQVYTLGAARAFTPASRLEARFFATAKAAKEDYYAYDSLAFALRHTWLLKKGMFLLTSAQLNRDSYRQEDSMVTSAKKRRDSVMKAGLTLGLPASRVYGGVKALENLTTTLSYDFLRDSSNLTNYTYNSNKVTLLFSYRWEAGI